MNVNGKTKITGIFGYPIEHTLSPLMHNTAFDDLGLDNCYVPFLVAPDDLMYAVQSIKAVYRFCPLEQSRWQSSFSGGHPQTCDFTGIATLLCDPFAGGRYTYP